MARTITEILNDKLQQVAADTTLSPLLTNTSKVSVYRLLLYISAVGDWAIENLQDIFKREVNETIAAMKPHSERWYAEKAKLFQYGFNLVTEADYYDNTGVAQSVVDASKIIAYAAVVEQANQSKLRVKVAKDTGTELGPLTNAELAAFVVYMQRVKDAGVKLNITSTAADELLCYLRVKYNALVLNAAGGRIDGTDPQPIQNAINNFLKSLPFNGVFSVQKFVDAIQAVEGVEDVKVDQILAQYGALPFASIDIDYTPDSGYMRIQPINLTILFQAA